MKITGLQTLIVGNPWKNWLFVRVETDAGLHGVGEGTFNGFARTTEAAVHEIKHLVLGEDPFNTERISLTLARDLYTDGGHVHRGAMAAIEIACLDIKGKALGVPVYQLLGGKVRDRIKAYANGWYRCPRTPHDFAESAKVAVGRGFRALKFDPFGSAHLTMDPSDETLSIRIVEAVRAAVGPDVELMIEAHCRFTVGQAVKIARRLEPYHITWYEEPCHHHRISDTIEVARLAPVPVASGESLHSKQLFTELMAPGVVAVYQPEWMALGGLVQARQVAAMAEAFNGVVAPHNAQGPLGTAACLHLAASCTNYLVLEFFDPFNVAWESSIVTRGFTLNDNGTVTIPDEPGLGVDLVLEEIAKHPYQVANFLPLFADNWNKRESVKLRSV